MSGISTLGSPSDGPTEMVLFDFGGVTIKGKRTISGGISLVRVTTYDSGASRCFDLPPEALAGLAVLLASSLPCVAHKLARSGCPAGMEPDVHEALLAASGQSDSVAGRA